MSYQPGNPKDKWEWSSWVLGRPGYPQEPPKTGVRGQLVQHPIRTLLIIIALFVIVIFGSYALFGNPALSADHETVVGTVEFDGSTCCPVYQEVDDATYLYLPLRKDSSGFFSTGLSSDIALRVVRLEGDEGPDPVATLDAPIAGHLPGSTVLTGSTLYIPLGMPGDGEFGVWSVDVSNPESPEDAGLIETEQPYSALTIDDNGLLITHAPGYFDLFDVTEAGELEQITSYRRPIGGVQRMQALEERLYYRESRTNRVRIDDLSDLQNPEPLGRYQTGTRSSESAVHPSDRVTSADELLEQNAPAKGLLDFVVGGDYLYAAVSDTGLEVVDVSDPTAPDKLSDIQLDGRAVRTTIMDGDLYVVTAGEESFQRLDYEVHRFDLTDPAEPESVDVIDNIQAVPGRQAIGASGGYLVLGLNDTLLVLEPGD